MLRQALQDHLDARAATEQRLADTPAPVPGPTVRPDGQAGPRDLLVLSIDATGINMIDSGLQDKPTGPR